MGSDQAEQNFLDWCQTAFQRKANRLANCGQTGRPLDCRIHEEHKFFGLFKCQCRYCRQCGGDIFSALFSKYLGLWSSIKRLLPQPGCRSSVVIAKLDFTAVNLERMPTPREIREFNQDIRGCLRRVLNELGIGSAQYGFLWCDEFGGFDARKNTYNTNLHAHGVYVGPYVDQKLLAEMWGKIRAARDGAKVVWIQRQRIDNPPADFYECEHRRFVRALGHALKYTGKHVSRSDGERLAQLEIAFHGVRRVHTMGLFYHADVRCHALCDGHLDKSGVNHSCVKECALPAGHEGPHSCRNRESGNHCPLCLGELMFPQNSGYASVLSLKKDGRRELGEVRRQVARERVFAGPRGPAS